jgi:hypothetical protein
MQFRNFLRRPTAQERFGYALPDGITDRLRRMRDIMSGVSRQMSLAWD